MKEEEAKNAFNTIKTIIGSSDDTEAELYCTGIINNLLKRAVADYKQFLKDQQENAIEMWRLVDSEGHVMPSDHKFYEDSKCWRDELQEKNPKLDFGDYEPKLFREVMDNE